MTPEIEGYLIQAAIGFVAGLLAGIIMGKSNDIIINMILGIVGAFVGSYVLGELGLTAKIATGTPLLDKVIVATIGAVIIIFVVGIIRSLLRKATC